MAYYLDTSAAVKLVVRERGSAAMRRWIAQVDSEIVGSDLVRTELLRTVRRGAPHAVVQARAVLDALVLLGLPSEVFERAAMLESALLRSLDALHLAVALQLGDELDGIVTYDARLAEAAESLGVQPVRP